MRPCTCVQITDSGRPHHRGMAIHHAPLHERYRCALCYTARVYGHVGDRWMCRPHFLIAWSRYQGKAVSSQCAVLSCDREATFARGMCRTHWHTTYTSVQRLEAQPK